MKGIVRNWHGTYGFAEPVSGSQRAAFFHRADMTEATRQAIRNGCEVEFDLDDDDERGPRAKNVRVTR